MTGEPQGAAKLRVVIVDDEKMARRRIRRLLDALGSADVVGEYASAAEVLPALRSEDVDVALLDVDMPSMNGLEVAEIAALRGVAVVFVTAHDKHAVEAFGKGAVHYLLKPVDARALESALARVRTASRSSAALPAANPPQRIALSVRGDVCFVDVADISHATFDGTLVTVHTDGQERLVEGSLQDLHGRLPEDDFIRVHRRALIQLSHVDRLKTLSSGGYTAVMRSGAEVPVSRQAGRALRKRFEL